jgi:mono/diheme cytochrome c family protein
MTTCMYHRMALAGLCGLLMSATVFFGCGHQSKNVAAPRIDSTKTFMATFGSPGNSTDLTRDEMKGKLVYNRYCRVCHGEDGDGKGFNAFNLKNSFGVQPADFTDSTFMASVTSKSMMNVIANGGKALSGSQYMPSWGATLTREEIQNVGAYVTTFSVKKSTQESKK